MFKAAAILSTIVILFGGESVAKVSPDFVNVCPGLKPECLKKTIQEIIPQFTKGVPSLGLLTLDPLRQDRQEYTLAGGLKVLFYDGFVHGLKDCIVDSARLDNEVADVDLHCNLFLKGKYKASGRILIVTLNGDGDARIKINNMILNAKLKLHDKTRNGVVYSEVKEYTVKHRFGDKVIFGLTNLFKGNPQISEAVLTFLNDNWKQVAEEFGNPIVDRVVKIALDSVKKFFHEIPKNELLI